MAPARRFNPIWLAAMLMGVAASSVLFGSPTRADTFVASTARTLAAELRVARGDLALLENANLPEAHRAGLEARLVGSLGLLPWLLIEIGDDEHAGQLGNVPADDVEGLAYALDTLIARHPFDLAERGSPAASANALLEARAIHEAYCAGCHDDTGNGDPEMMLPIRDLFEMARSEPADIFAARLYMGVKGDETIGFRNPLSEEQFLALWRYYSTD